MTTDHYGRGAAYPLSVGPTGGVRESAGVDRVEDSIRIILGTQHGERMMRPDFGANLRSVAFAPNSPATANLTRHLVESGLARWEPRIEVLRIEVVNDLAENALLITLSYRLRGTQDVRSLDYLFALEAT